MAGEGGGGDGVVQYRGIKYAFLRDQMAVPELVTEYGSEKVDAREFGYVGFCFSPFLNFLISVDFKVKSLES